MTVGYDKLNLNHQLLLGLTFEEMTGTITHDRAKPEHPCTLHGATIVWGSLASGLPYIDFTAATPDWIDCPAAATNDLDFTTENFTLLAWIYIDDLSVSRALLFRGLLNVDGWRFYVDNAGRLCVFVEGGGGPASRQANSGSGEIVIANWYLAGATRNGTAGNVYKNGQNVTFYSEGFVNPLTANRELHIGVQDDEVSWPFDGRIALPRIWGRALAEWEFLEIFNIERHWFGV